MRSKAVFGIYESKASVDTALEQLKIAAFSANDVSVLMPTRSGAQGFAHARGSKAPEGAIAGVTSGAAIGGGLGWLVGLGALSIPGIGPLVAAGPVVSALAGASVGGTVLGIAGALVGLGIPEFQAKRYEGLIHNGGILLSIHVEDAFRMKRAKKILKSTGARDITVSGESGLELNAQSDIR